MAISVPYLSSNRNVEKLFATIAAAKVPERFTQDFLLGTIGLKGSNDRQLIAMLKNLGFLDQSGAPTAAYRLLKSADTAPTAIADGIRRAYAPLFAANESAHALAPEKLKGLVAQVAGTDDGMTGRIFQTLQALLKCADFSSGPSPAAPPSSPNGVDEDREVDAPVSTSRSGPPRGLRPEFHYNIQVHLPNNATEEVYLNIFNALRKTFQ